MNTNANDQQQAINRIYNYAADQMLNQNKNEYEVIQDLTDKGIDKESATMIVNKLNEQIGEAKKEQAKKNMLYGALWCVGGTVATLAQIGYIFWGAIIFGAIQFIKGLYDHMSL